MCSCFEFGLGCAPLSVNLHHSAELRVVYILQSKAWYFQYKVQNFSITYLSKERSHYDSLSIVGTGKWGVQLFNDFGNLLRSSLAKGPESTSLIINTPFLSCHKPLFHIEAKCQAIDTKMIFCSDANKTDFHKKGFPLSLALKVRVFGNREWPISFLVDYYLNVPHRGRVMSDLTGQYHAL